MLWRARGAIVRFAVTQKNVLPPLREILTRPHTLLAVSASLAAVCNLLTYKLIAIYAPVSVLADYTFGRRAISFLVPVLAVGYGVSLPLRLASRRDPREASRLLVAHFISITAVCAVAISWAVVAPANVLWKWTGFDGPMTFAAVTLCSLSATFTALHFAVFRGLQDFRLAALVAILTNGIFPLLSVLVVRFGAPSTFATWAAMNALFAMVIFRKLPPMSRCRIERFPTFLLNSASRIPGDLAYAALFFLPVIFAAQYATSAELAVFSFFFTILGLLVTLSVPTSVILLPQVGRVLALGQVGRARKTMARALCAGAILGLPPAIMLFLAPELLVHALLSAEYEEAAHVFRRLAPACVGLSLFLFTKSVLDAADRKPLTAIVSGLSLITYYVVWYTAPVPSLAAVVAAVDASFSFLGLASALLSLKFMRGWGMRA